MKKLQRTALAAVIAATLAGGLGVATAASAQPAAAGQNSRSATDGGGGVRANERVVETFLHEVIGDHDGSATAGLVTSDVSWHGGTLGVVSGRANVTGLFTGIVTALPDLRSTVSDVVAQGDQVVVRQILTGTQKGAIIGIPASGRTVTWNAVDLFVLRDGQISQIWAGDDWTAILNDTGTYKAPWIS
ncbi:MAG TPA: ester cyclase [Pseudonocardiaceae bacterium]